MTKNDKECTRLVNGQMDKHNEAKEYILETYGLWQ